LKRLCEPRSRNCATSSKAKKKASAKANNRLNPSRITHHASRSAVCVLVSGGLDSCVMLAELACRYRTVYPVFIRQGLRWETIELHHLRRFLRAILPSSDSSVLPLTVLSLPARDLYGLHWSTTGRAVPGARTRDAAVCLPGRNLMLLVKAAVFCALHRIPVIAVGSLGHNPFPDATPGFFRSFARLVGLQVLAPFRQLTKTQVIRRGRQLPLHLTFSCLAPQRGLHCGRCNKCAERQRAFHAAGVEDRTRYVVRPQR